MSRAGLPAPGRAVTPPPGPVLGSAVPRAGAANRAGAAVLGLLLALVLGLPGAAPAPAPGPAGAAPAPDAGRARIVPPAGPEIPAPSAPAWTPDERAAAERLRRTAAPRVGGAPSTRALPRVRGIYVPPGFLGRRERLYGLVALVERSELNALVLDVKGDDGYLTYASELPEARALGAVRPLVGDMAALVADLKARGIYLIARVVTFKDPVAAPRRPEWAVRLPDGSVWRDRKGMAWLSPYHPEARAYVLAVAREVVALGFDEVQFDYVRFPSDGPVDRAVYPAADGRPRERVIVDFLREARRVLGEAGAWASADVFGQVPSVAGDMGIGQVWEAVATSVDVISPMLYPSHYRAGVYGLRDPDAAPYETVRQALADALRRVPPGTGAAVRPWLQDFSLRHPYGPEQVRAQIRAVYDAGLAEWLLWDPAGRYSEGALGRDEAAPDGAR